MFITWLATKLGIPSILIYVISIAVASGGAFWWLKVHDAKIAEKYIAIGVKNGIEQIKIEKEKEWALIDIQIAAEKEKNLAVYQEIEKMKETLAGLRADAAVTLQKIKDTAHTQIVEIPAQIAAIPPDRLIDSIRVQSAVLEDKLPETVVYTGILAESESRKVLEQLTELSYRRTQVTQLESYIEIDKKNDLIAVDTCTAEIKAKEDTLSICTQEKNVAMDKAKFFEDAYNIITKKPSWKCRLLHWLSFGTHVCK
jgi:hypothetical protein